VLDTEKFVFQFILTVLGAACVFFRSRPTLRWRFSLYRAAGCCAQAEMAWFLLVSPGSNVLDDTMPRLVPMGRGHGYCETRDRRRLPPSRVSALLEVAITRTRGQTASYS
jgi:hypothetical protein